MRTRVAMCVADEIQGPTNSGQTSSDSFVVMKRNSVCVNVPLLKCPISAKFCPAEALAFVRFPKSFVYYETLGPW